MSQSGFTPKPSHVPDDLVYDFDFYNFPGGMDDVHLALKKVQDAAPDIFWTPRNGGHWVVTRAEDLEHLGKDPSKWSCRRTILPRDDTTAPSIPVESDPPEHTDYRAPLNQALIKIDALEAGVRELTISLIEDIASRGECEFVKDFAKVMPMCLFLDMVKLPREDRHMLIPLVEKFLKGGTVEARQEAQQAFFGYLLKVVRERRANPGDDLASLIVNCKVQGQRIDEQKALAYMALALNGGLDTIAATLSYVFKFLAENPGHMAQVRDNVHDEVWLGKAIEEFLRRFGVASNSKLVVHDIEYKGIKFKENESIYQPFALGGLDDKRFQSPLEVDFNRPNARMHTTFGKGIHFCPGAPLARREMKVVLQEWFKRIPDFRLKPGTEMHYSMGMTSALEALPLVWDTKK